MKIGLRWKNKHGFTMPMVLVFMLLSHLMYISIIRLNQIRSTHIHLHRQYSQALIIYHVTKKETELSNDDINQLIHQIDENTNRDLSSKYSNFSYLFFNQSPVSTMVFNPDEQTLLEVQYEIYYPDVFQSTNFDLKYLNEAPIDVKFIEQTHPPNIYEGFDWIDTHVDSKSEMIAYPKLEGSLSTSLGHVNYQLKSDQIEYLVTLDNSSQIYRFLNPYPPLTYQVITVTHRYHKKQTSL